jgi:hypothetical protein
VRLSHAKAHFQQASAASIATATDAIDPQAASAYELMLYKLTEDKRQLKNVQSIERKAEVKAKLLPDYLPWINGVLESDSGRQDDVLMTVFVWSIDIGNFPLALQIGRYAISHKLTMPDQYKRDVPCVLAEEVADFAIKAADADRIPLLEALEMAISLTDGCDMPDEVRAKLYKAYGYTLRASNELRTASAMLIRALELDQRVGVKKDIERLDTLIKNSTPAVDAEKSAETSNG